jgi:uncharacterized protein (DUF1684 family)
MTLSLLGWRRTVSELYAAVRATPDPEAAWNRWCAARDRLFAEHPDSPVERSRFRGFQYRPYDLALRFVLPVQAAEPARLEVSTTTDGIVPFSRAGRVELPGLGTLDVWWLESYGGGIFLPLRDATCGRTSYGGGRYLLDTVKGADLGEQGGRLVVDLNFLYNPSCAYDERWACPLPPAGNVLSVPVEAGEFGTRS